MAGDMNFFADEDEANDLQQRIIDILAERFEVDEKLTFDASLAAVIQAILMDIAKVCGDVVQNEINVRAETPEYKLDFGEIHRSGVVVGKLVACIDLFNSDTHA
jgi:hypothetical protein